MQKFVHEKKSILLLLMMLIVSSMVFGCGGQSDQSDQSDKSAEQTGKAATRTITDMVGREVEVPANVQTFVALGNTPRMITYLGLAENAVGISGSAPEDITPLTAYAYANKDLWADTALVGTDAGGMTDYYPEEIIRVNPDVILCSYPPELADEIQTRTNIPVVAVEIGTLFGQDYEEALTLLAEVCGVPDKAQEVIAFINDCLDDINTRTAGIPSDDRPAVLGAAATFKGVHGIDGVYVNNPVFSVLNANDVTKDISDTSTTILVDKEQIISWDPDYIFLDFGGVPLVKDDFKQNPDFYAQLSAVRNGKIYQHPSSTSYYSNVEIPLVNCYFIGSTIAPEEFEDIVFEDKAKEIFRFFLGDADYLNKLEEYGASYGAVTLLRDN